MDEPSASSSQQHMTIFYNGCVSVCDVTELQARTIIWLASRELEVEKAKGVPAERPSISVQSQQQCNSISGLSMKRSLQTFLQMRKTRAGSTSS